MISKKIFSIYDRKAETYGEPILQPTLGSMLRALEQEFENEDSMLSKYPEDYVLYELGTFNVENGEIDWPGYTDKDLETFSGEHYVKVDKLRSVRVAGLEELRRPHQSVAEKSRTPD